MTFESNRRRVSLFIGGADPRDIKQGMLGDCWLLSAMSVLASGKDGTSRVGQVIIHAVRPWLRHAGGCSTSSMSLHSRGCSHRRRCWRFRGQDLNKGYYVIKLYRAATGSWHRFVVDDFFPCGVRASSLPAPPPPSHASRRSRSLGPVLAPLPCRVAAMRCAGGAQEDQSPLFGHCADPETWVMVMEKGYAKFCQAPSQGSVAADASRTVPLHDGCGTDGLNRVCRAAAVCGCCAGTRPWTRV